MASREFKSKTTAAPLSRRDLLRAGSLLVPAAALAPGIFTRSAQAQASTSTFDYYISPSGSDSNAGTQGSPWSITAINTKQATYAGKRVGLMDGTYTVYSLLQGGLNDGYVPVLQIQGGRSGSPTVIQAVTLGSAILECSNGAAITSVNSPLLGQNTASSMGYVTIDGLKIQNGGSKVIYLGNYGNAASAGRALYAGYTVQNCEFTGQNTSPFAAGNNFSCLELAGAIAPLINNNYFHGNIGNVSATDGNHYTSVIQWYTERATYQYNTCIGPGLYGKESGNFGTTIQFNYIDGTGWTSVYGIEDFVGRSNTASGYQTTIHHNIFVSLQNDMRPTLGAGNYLPDPFVCFNNVFVVLSSGQSAGLMIPVQTGAATFYNNIVSSNATGDLDLICVNTDGPGVWDYNLYYSTTGTYVYGYFTSKTSETRNGVSTLASWKQQMAASCEAHAVDHANPLFANSGTLATRYQLQSGSPAKNAGSTTGTTKGSVCDMGAWGNGAPTVIGSTLAAGGSTPPPQIPQAPSLTVS
jgi:hypothetical protein